MTDALTAAPGGSQEPCFEKLSPGPGLSGDEVIANQRARLCRAMVELAAADGYKRVTVRGLSREAGVSTRAFYACFPNVEKCFDVTYKSIVRDLLRSLLECPTGDEDPVRERIRVFFHAFADDPKAARLVLVEPLAVGPVAVARAEDAAEVLRRMIADGLAASDRGPAPPPPILRGVIAAAFYAVRSRLLAPEPTEVGQLADEFADWALGLHAAYQAAEGWTGPIHEFPPADSRRPPEADGDRGRLLAAMTKLSGKQPYQELQVSELRRAAGVSRRSFDASFGSIEALFLGAVEEKLDTAAHRAAREAATTPNWERGVARASIQLCAEIVRDPSLARLGFLEPFAPGPEGLDRLDHLVADWGRRLRETGPPELRTAALAAEASVIAAWRIARAEAAAPSRRLPTTAANIAFVLLAPLVGAEAADEAIQAEFGGLSRRVRTTSVA